jgi:membrane protein DedA with SNARE-associated domain/rhodanese-related sulfurtransferase
MDSLLTALSHHGYSLLFAIVFVEAVGFPVPAAIAMLIAGAACARGALSPALAVTGAIAAMMLGDTLMFVLGRYTGWWLLGILCRISLNPESCILRSADSFYRRGRMLLVIAKFLPGINTMAPPLAGSMNMRAAQFLRLDLAGTALYIGTCMGLGFVFSGALEAITRGYHTFGRAVNGLVVLALVGYVGWQLWLWTRARPWETVPFVHPSEVAPLIASGDAVIYDVRSHGYYERDATRIQGSTRLDPHAIQQRAPDVPAGKQIFLYCTCVREATSARVAHRLREMGVRTSVIKGGLRAWKKAGLPTESVPLEEMMILPMFDV